MNMGSIGNPNPWPSYDTSCSQGICTLYCPHYCYFFLPPPPSSSGLREGSGTLFSPLVIAVIVLLATGLIFATYYAVVAKYFRRNEIDAAAIVMRLDGSLDHDGFDQWHAGSDGLDEATIKAIRVCRYRSGDALIECGECVVCLVEFRDGDPLRLLPKCRHAFHLPCIDTWLRSHSTCPLCRAGVVALAHADVDSGGSEAADEVILTVEEEDEAPPAPAAEKSSGGEGFRALRRSVSLGEDCWKRHGLMMSNDVMKKLDQDLLLQVGNDLVGPSKGFAIKRSFSTGRFIDICS
ncbi:RING-H2 finger protein ATL51-like [Andrographis paniculata]|uniref:RING-H2 finger protein ATL51-like n=1 Tax=Andrographis paniculata TaxID=175694 RepID=UPI0021E8B09B|nr:RING-H2 finger protein ATL51-like [Andrographis paniculata]